MDGIFTIPYSEFSIINNLTSYFKKYDGFSMFIPANRQEKGIDFIILNTKTKKVATVQVKSSRVYSSNDATKSPYEYHIWLNNFIDKYKKGNADFYMIYGLYPVYNTDTKVSSKQFWKDITLCYTETEMFSFLKNIKTKSGKMDKFFGYGFDSKENIFATRGLRIHQNANEYLLKNKIADIRNHLE